VPTRTPGTYPRARHQSTDGGSFFYFNLEKVGGLKEKRTLRTFHRYCNLNRSITSSEALSNPSRLQLLTAQARHFLFSQMYHFQQTIAIATVFIASFGIVQAFVHNFEIRLPSQCQTSNACANDNSFLYRQTITTNGVQTIFMRSPLYFKPPWKQNKVASSPPPKTKTELDLEELQKAARDPKAFEAYVLKKNNLENAVDNTEEKSDDNVDDSPTLPKKKGYVPIEQWDADRKKDSMSWEEKVQYDGQRFGNRVNQNEILRNNIHRF
jgi:hypothetical protein